MQNLIEQNYNPDVVTCIANLSNDEVFTPPKLANAMLDLLPEEIWSNPEITFLDPVSKSGIFLREIARRLDEGLKNVIPEQQERINHIFTRQVYGISITELTGLLSRRTAYCSKTANGKYSVCDVFENDQGNIIFNRIEHEWNKEKCIWCGASEINYSRDETLETHAYHFIHTENPEELFDMKFDVIVGNPPYQLSDGGFGRSASPIYNKFVTQAKKLNPRYLSMIIPSRWFAGGKGLDDFREEMLNDDRTRNIVDYESSSEVFPGVDIAGGVCFFLWDKDFKGDCEITNMINGRQVKSTRALNEFNTFVRHGQAVSIIRKIIAKSIEGRNLSNVISSRKPFGLATNYTPKKKGVPCWFKQSIGLKFAKEEDINDIENLIDKWKLLIPPAPIAGQTDFSKPISFYYDSNTRIAKPGECCTESWLVACAFPTKKEVLSFRSYLLTKVVRFLLLQNVVSQHVTKQRFLLIPDMGKYEGEYTDEILCNKFGITKKEWEFIDSKIA